MPVKMRPQRGIAADKSKLPAAIPPTIGCDHQSNISPSGHVIYVTWAGEICLICTHEPEGMQCLRVSVGMQHLRASLEILGKS